jgi:hypothetical protein
MAKSYAEELENLILFSIGKWKNTAEENSRWSEENKIIRISSGIAEGRADAFRLCAEWLEEELQSAKGKHGK